MVECVFVLCTTFALVIKTNNNMKEIKIAEKGENFTTVNVGKLNEIKEYPQIRNYAPNMIQKRKESASLVKRGHSASNVTIKTYKCPLPHHAT